MGTILRKLVWLAFLALPPGIALGDQQKNWVDPDSGIEFIQISAGCFPMGADKANGFEITGEPIEPRQDEVPRHEVCVDAFWIGKYEVTRGQWARVMGEMPGYGGTDMQPATHISWEDAQAFITRLNEKGSEHFRLPTEAEWEFACRPGEPAHPLVSTKPWIREAQLNQVAWYRRTKADIDPDVTEVGQLAPSPNGLHDMLGNVWEWTSDVYLEDGYTRHHRDNPQVDAGSNRRVLRGGSFKNRFVRVRCGARAYGLPNDRLATAGLRVVRSENGK